MMEFSTAGLPSREGRRAWEARLVDVCYRAPDVWYPREDFRAALSVRDIAGISIGRFAHNARELHISASSTSGCPGFERSIYLIMPLTDSRIVRQANREIVIPPRTLAVVDDALPYSFSYDRSAGTVVARLPTAQLLKAGPQGQTPLGRVHTHAITSDAGIGALVRSTLLTILRSADRFDGQDEERARDILVSLIRSALEREWCPRRDCEQNLPERRVRNFIEARLADPDLSPGAIAAGCGVSVRQLHRIFGETEWSVGDWIRKRRLERCREELLDPAFDMLSITQIAFRWGFNDAAHFTKKFREAYATTPSSVRKGAPK